MKLVCSMTFLGTLHLILCKIREHLEAYRTNATHFRESRVKCSGGHLPRKIPFSSIPNRYLWISNDLIMAQQKGVFRVNCIDCLDRTNVVEVRSTFFVACFKVTDKTHDQSAFARHVLKRQLGSVALQYPSGIDRMGTDVVFNDGTIASMFAFHS